MYEEQENQVLTVKEQEGYKYIRLQLDPREGFKGQQRIRFSGVKIAKIWEDGIDRETGLPKEVVNVQGGCIDFFWEEEKRGWFGSLLDDSEGYNRKFLASHIISGKVSNKVHWNKYKPGESQFLVLDADIRHDIFNLRREMDGEKIERIKPISDVDAMKAKIAEMEKRDQEKELELSELREKVGDVKPLKGKVTESMKDKIAAKMRTPENKVGANA